MAGSDALRQAMVEGLALRGELDERWRAVVSEVPRHEFIPELVWCHDRDRAGYCDLVPLRRSEDPQRWLRARRRHRDHLDHRAAPLAGGR